MNNNTPWIRLPGKLRFFYVIYDREGRVKEVFFTKKPRDYEGYILSVPVGPKRGLGKVSSTFTKV